MRGRSIFVGKHLRRIWSCRQELHAGDVSVPPDRYDAVTVAMLPDEQIKAPGNGEALREHHGGTEAREVLDKAWLSGDGELVQDIARKAGAGPGCRTMLLHEGERRRRVLRSPDCFWIPDPLQRIGH